jgi:CRISPR-associated protein Csb2
LVSTRQTVVVADAMRAAAMSQYGTLFGGAASEVLAGKDHAGAPLRGNRHAHWLPLDLDGDRLLDTVLVWARDGFGQEEIAALGSIRTLHFHGGDRLGATSLDVGVEVVVTEPEVDRLSLPGVVGPAVRWRSVTPFLPQRHNKGREVDDWLADCVRRELAARGIEVPFNLEREREQSWGSFRRHRRAERQERARPGYGMTLTFEQAVPGPLSIGLLSHFGMGRFEHVRTKRTSGAWTYPSSCRRGW